MPTFSFIIPTHRPDRPLRRCLDSVAPQMGEGDEVIVVGDSFDWTMPEVGALVTAYGPQFRYVEHDAGHHCYGHCQLNHAMPLATGDYIHLNDDDDVWAPGAVTVMRLVAQRHPDQPLLFRFRSYVGGQIFWMRPGLFERNTVGGHCLVVPNIPGKVGKFACEYSGDWDWIESTVALQGGIDQVIWREEIVAIARPT